MKIKLLIIIGLVSFLGYSGFSQELPNIVSPTPEVSQLTKFIETPVNYSNGLPTISIPLFTIVQDGITIPITLDYHARGIKVDEVSSNIGLGWALNGVGIISRQVRGMPDEYGLLNYQGSYLLNAFENEAIRRQIFSNQGLGTDDFDHYTPDQFFYSFPGGSGKFIFDYVDKKPVLQSQSQGLKLESFNDSYNHFEKFEITDKNGNRYFFGKSPRADSYKVSKETALQYFTAREPILSLEITNGQGSDDISGWHLIDIETVNRSLIEFKYKQSNTISYRRSYDKKENEGIASYFSKVSFQENTIQEIIFKNGRIVFENNSDLREDITFGEKLEWVKIYDKNDVLIKKIKLNHFYSYNSDSQNVLPYLYNADPTAKKRLFLQSIEEIDIHDANKKNIYSFEYNLNNSMPNRHSNAKDLWGYYNGENNRNSILPLESGTGNRRVNSALSGIGLLNKITYPTGGFTKYTYEDNIVVRDSKIDEVVLAGGYPNPIDEKNTGLSNLESADYYNGSIYSKPFTIGENASHFKYTLWFTDNVACQTGSEIECKFGVWIRSVDSQQNISLILTPGTNKMINYPLPAGNYYMLVDPRIGEYNPFDMDNGFNLNITWGEEIRLIDGTSNTFFAGGKRIKKIEKYKNENQLAFHKEYEYIDDEGILSGRLNGLPDFFAIKRIANLNGVNVPIVENYGSGHGSPLSAYQGNSVSYTQVTEYTGSKASNIGKSVYTFTHLDDTGDYWIFPYNIPTDNDWLRGLLLKERHYSFVNQQYQLKKQIENRYTYGLRNSEYNTDVIEGGGELGEMSAADYTLFPPVYTIPMSYNIPDEKYKYRKEKGYFRIPFFLAVRSELDYPNSNVDKYWAEGTFPPRSFDLVTGNGNPYYLYYKTFFITGGFVNIGKTISTDYYDTGNLVTETEYKYQNNNHLQLTEKITTNSIEEVVKTNYFYADDTNNQLLIDKNIIGVPLRIVAFKGVEKLSEIETVYKDWNNGLLAPEIIKTAKGNATNEVKIRYNKVDNTNGNPLEVQQEDGIPISYIWGYNKSQPVAKLENVPYISIPLNYIQAIETASNANNEANLISALNALRNDSALSNSMITTYTYKPLVGISTVTDSKGDKQAYHYDGFGRLQFVKDKDGNILNENKYHFKN